MNRETRGDQPRRSECLIDTIGEILDVSDSGDQHPQGEPAADNNLFDIEELNASLGQHAHQD